MKYPGHATRFQDPGLDTRGAFMAQNQESIENTTVVALQ